MFHGCHRDLVQPYRIFLSTNDHGYVPFVVITLVVSSALGLQQWVSRVEQALLTHPESMGLIPVLSRIFGARSFVLCVVFCRYFFPFPFGHGITDVLLPLWYLLTFLYLTQHLLHDKDVTSRTNSIYGPAFYSHVDNTYHDRIN